MSKPLTLPEAIARQEGFGKPNTRATRNHNPGNLNYGATARLWDAVGPDDKGYAVFKRDEDGWKALRYLLQSPAYRGRTLHQALEKYAPPTGDPRGLNDLKAYVKNVCDWTGMQPETCIDGFIRAKEA
jgi:hypothetical protein